MKIKGNNVRIVINLFFLSTLLFNIEFWTRLVNLVSGKNNLTIIDNVGYVVSQLLFYLTSLSFVIFCFNKKVRLNQKYLKINVNLNIACLFLLLICLFVYGFLSFYFAENKNASSVIPTLIITLILIAPVYIANIYTLFEFDKKLKVTQETIGKNGFTKLMAYAVNGDEEKLESEITKSNLNDVDEKGYTALMYASANGHSECVRLLLENGADKTIATSKGNKAVDFAEMNNHFTVRDMLR